VFGWLAFVLVAFAIGNAAGMVTLKSGEGENGQSRLADQTLAQQFPRQRAGEEVLFESPKRAVVGGWVSGGGDGPRGAPAAHPEGFGYQVAARACERRSGLEGWLGRAAHLPD